MKLAAHVIAQHWSQQDDDWVKRLQPKSIKMVDFFDRVSRMRELCPNSLIVWRDWALSEQKDDVRRNPKWAGWAHAETWGGKIPLHMPKDKTVVVGINEPPVWEDPKPWVDYTVAFLDGLAKYGIRGGALNLSVGWPANTGTDTPPDWTPYEPVHKALRRGKHFLVLHEYWDKRGPEHMWGWWAGRYTQCPWDVPIIIGECGLDQYVSDPGVSKHKRGWQGQVDAETYWAQLQWYEAQLQKDKRIHSAQIFTWDYAGNEWASFDVRPVLDRMPTNNDFNHTHTTPVVIDTPVVDTPSKVPALVHPITDPSKRRITQKFGENPQNYAPLRGHPGLDFSVPVGTQIRAADDGIVLEAGERGPNGKLVRIRHDWGETAYLHLDSFRVVAGQHVVAGEAIARSGNTGRSTGPHLDFMLRVFPLDLKNGYNGYVDALPYLTGEPLPTPANDADLLARIITAEAGGESLEGQLAVAWVVMNRAKRPGWWGKTLREVMTKKSQFAKPADAPTGPAATIAALALGGHTIDPTNGADHFHSGPPPKWADSLIFTKKIGGHFFYRSKT